MNFISRSTCVAVFFLIAAANALALSTDRQLIALVPPESAVVAGVGLSPTGQQPIGNLLLVSKISWEDVGKFWAWTGADASREIHHLMLASLDFIPGDGIHHSLLAKGRFNRTRIYNSLIRNGGEPKVYRGIQIATVPQAPSRAGETALYLAVLDDEIVLLGSEAMVQEELDRYIAGMEPAPTLLQSLAQIDGDDVAWSMVAISGRTKELKDFVSSLDPKLPQILSNGEIFLLGVHYKKQIRLEFRVLVNPGRGVDDGSESSIETLPETAHRSSLSFLPSERQTFKWDVLLSRRAYTRWLDERSRSWPLH